MSTNSSFSPLILDAGGFAGTSYSLSGLANNTLYYWRVNATNASGSSGWSASWSFTTISTAPPAVTTNTATAVGSASATLNAAVDPKGLSTAVSFEYGMTTSYGSQVTAAGSPITGTAAVNLSANVSGLSPSTTYHYRVVATNSIGTTRGGDQSFTTSALASISVTSTLTTWAAGFSYPVRWSSANLTGNVTIGLSTNGGGSYTSLGDFPNSGSATVTVPSSTAASANCKLRISATSAPAVFGESGIFTIVSGTLPSTVQLSTSFSFPAQPTSSTSYRLVSYPGNVGTTTLGQMISGSSPYDWRVYRDNGNASDFLVEFSAGSTLAVGEGYWLIAKGTYSLSKSVTAVSLSSDATYSIPLYSGWNIIGNPFLTGMSWSSVLAANGITPTAATRIQQYDGSYSESATLAPYSGYYFFNTNNLSALKIPYPFGGKVEVVNPAPPVAWKVQLKFSSDINEDSENYVGIAPSAKEGIDDLEGHKPPLFMDQGFLYFERPEWDTTYSLFSSDFRPSMDDGQVWNFTVRNPRRSVGSIRFSGLECVPPEFDIKLVNLSNTSPVDLRSCPVYSFRATDERTRFKLIVGRKQFLDGELATFVPAEYELLQNYPNPFNSSTTIMVRIPGERRVRLEVISLLGQTVRTLLDGWCKPGTYSVVWDGCDDRGGGVASGVYFYRLVSQGEPVQTRKLTILK